ncbi:unnamed protein product [Blepharisma stoltei]|uniref:Phosphodiesterase n=1 Tax=Blepharisma stoltei TaxID=1481888 RepID=A0AAU9INN1_9CILI|nr:unnamed protein product [Blepharisma stoltei]
MLYMSESTPKTIKPRQRRYTFDMQEADGSPNNSTVNNAKNNTKVMIPQALISLSGLVNVHHVPLGDIAKISGKLISELTSSSWVEVLLKEDNKLKIFNPSQPFTELEINDESLPGYVAQTQQPELITNPHTSTFYSTFQLKINPFSPATNKVIQPTTTACIPLVVEEWKVIGVVQLFNKVNEDLSQGYYTDIDIDIVSSFGHIMNQALKQRSEYLSLINKNEGHHAVNKEKDRLYNEVNMICKKKEYCKKLDSVIKPWYRISKALMDAVSDIMKTDGLILYSLRDGMLKCEYAHKIDVDICNYESRISEYVGFTHKDILNIKDLSIEPLWPQDVNYGYKSCLVLPIMSYTNTVQGVVEFFRSSSVFTEIDENFALYITGTLGKLTNLSVETNNSTSFEQDDLRKWINGMYSYTLDRKDKLFDYVKLTDVITQSLHNILPHDSSSVFIANQHKKFIWTKKSDSCGTMAFPLSPDTVFGYAYSLQKTLVLPNRSLPVLQDIELYAGKSVVIVPILAKEFKDPTIGLIVISREKTFSNDDLLILETFSSSLQPIFMRLFVENLPETMLEDCKIENSSPDRAKESSESEFKTVNVFRKNSELAAQSSFFLSQDLTRNREKNKKEPPFLLKSLNNILSMPRQTLESLYDLLDDLTKTPYDPYIKIARKLPEIVKCQVAKLFLYDKSQVNLIEQTTFSSYTPAGLIKKSIQIKDIVKIDHDAENDLNFEFDLDSLDCEDQVDSYLCVPIIDSKTSVIGVIAFVNLENLEENTLQVASFLSILPKEFAELASAQDDSATQWKKILETGRKHKMLQHWCKQVFLVANQFQKKCTYYRDMLYKISCYNDLENLMKFSIDLVQSHTNTKRAYIYLYKDSEFEELTIHDGEPHNPHEWELDFFKECYDKNSTIASLNPNQSYHLLAVPIINENDFIGLLYFKNKKEPTLLQSVPFTAEDIDIFECLAKIISVSLKKGSDSEEKRNNDDFKNFIKEIACERDSYALITTIRKAAEQLCDCDRAVIFIHEENVLVAKPQGLEQQLPANYSFYVGYGIPGTVASKKTTENIKDAYNDPRFTPDVDRLTGYRTTSILCMPILDSEKQVLAVIELINKRHATFDANDEETMDLFCEMVSAVLENCGLFEKTIEERASLLGILNSIGSYALALNSEGKLSYVNKPIEGVFGVNEFVVKKFHYTDWLKNNPSLVSDIQKVFNDPSLKPYKTSKFIYTESFRSSSFLSILPINDQVKSQKFNYRILGLKGINKGQFEGVVIILEDCSSLEEIHMKFKEVKSQIKALTTPLQTETELQRCIGDLEAITENGNIQQEIKDNLQDIMSRLKSGNLNRPKYRLDGPVDQIEQGVEALKSLLEIDMPVEHARTRRYSSISESSPDSLESYQQNVSLDDIRNWNFNAFSIEDPISFAFSLMNDFDLFKRFKIRAHIFVNFVEEVKHICDQKGNPFHNFEHNLSVMHGTYMLLASTSAGSYFKPADILALLVGSICHDLDHTGRNNPFECAKSSRLAVLYHDKSVLEQHHAATAFFTMQNENCNIFKHLKPKKFKYIRKLMIAAILQTDMSKHLGMISHMTRRFNDTTENPLGTLEKDTEKLAGLLLHSSDLAHGTKDFSIYEIWSRRVCEEFSEQYKEEVALGLTPTGFMKDLDKPKVYYSNEINFMKFVVKPLWECLNLWLKPNLGNFLQNIEKNIEEMQARLENEDETS